MSAASAEELRFEFTINPQISGSRPWDGTASGSSAVDGLFEGSGERVGDSIGGVLGSVIGQGIEVAVGSALDVTIDETQASIAPPDPYMCLITDPRPTDLIAPMPVTASDLTMFCTPRDMIEHNRTFFNLVVPYNYVNNDMFGVVLIDSDFLDDQLGTGPTPGVTDPDYAAIHNETIGFGLYLGRAARSALERRDQLVMHRVDTFEAAVTQMVSSKFGLSRLSSFASVSASSHSLDLERLSVERCETSCRFGDATVSIRDTEGGY